MAERNASGGVGQWEATASERRMLDVVVLEGAAHSSLAVVRNLGRRGVRVAVGAESHFACATASRYCSDVLYHPPVGRAPHAATRVLLGYVRAHPGVVILPNSDRWHAACYRWRDELESAGAILAMPAEATFRATCDKAATLQRAKRLGVPIPETYFPTSPEHADDLAEWLHYPVVIKARQSVVMRDGRLIKTGRVRYARSAGQLRSAYRAAHAEHPDPMIQEFAPGRGMGVFLLCDRGRPVMRFAHRRLRDVVPTGSASALRESVAYPSELGGYAERLASDLDFTGPMMIEFRVDPVTGRVSLMEINSGRFWGSLQLAIDAGQEFPYAWYRMARGETVIWPDHYLVGVRCRWLIGDLQSLARTVRGRPAGFPGPFPSRWRAIREFFTPNRRPSRLEVLRGDDPRPFWMECAHYSARLLERTPLVRKR